MSPAERRICALCGRAFALVMPPGEEATERDRLCPELPGAAGAAEGRVIGTRKSLAEIQMTSKDVLLNDFATRSFRDVADHDYISARMCYRARLFSQFSWSGLQALEKYLKAILLYNRIPATDVWHDLAKPLFHAKKLPFEVRMSASTKDIIEHLDTYGRYRYLEGSFFIQGPKLVQLDKAVWEIRRYCRVLDYDSKDTGKNMLAAELASIEAAEGRPPQEFRLLGGTLEHILRRTDDAARAPLLWQNAFYGLKPRRKVRMHVPFSAVNAPLALHPELLDEVRKYVFLPKHVVAAYRAELTRRAQARRAAPRPGATPWVNSLC